MNTLCTNFDGLENAHVGSLYMQGNRKWHHVNLPDHLNELGGIIFEDSDAKTITGGDKINYLEKLEIKNNKLLGEIDLGLYLWDSIQTGDGIVGIIDNPNLNSVKLHNPNKMINYLTISDNNNLQKLFVASMADNELTPLKLIRCILENNAKLDSVEGFSNAIQLRFKTVVNNYSLNQLCAVQTAILNMNTIEPNSGMTISNNSPQLQSLNDLLTMDCSWYEAVTIEESSLNEKLLIYPNPAINVVNFNKPYIGNYFITNIMGKVVQQGALENSNYLQLNNLISGVYFLKVENKVIKLVVE